MSEQPERKRKGKRLLVAAVGVATASYVIGSGCGVQTSSTTSGNLVPPPPRDAAAPQQDEDASDRMFLSPAGNLMARPEALDAALPSSGNLVPPPNSVPADRVDASSPELLQATSGNLMPPPPTKKKK